MRPNVQAWSCWTAALSAAGIAKHGLKAYSPRPTPSEVHGRELDAPAKSQDLPHCNRARPDEQSCHASTSSRASGSRTAPSWIRRTPERDGGTSHAASAAHGAMRPPFSSRPRNASSSGYGPAFLWIPTDPDNSSDLAPVRPEGFRPTCRDFIPRCSSVGQ